MIGLAKVMHRLGRTTPQAHWTPFHGFFSGVKPFMSYQSKVHPLVNTQENVDTWDYESACYRDYGLSDDYELLRKIGRGKYSEVFLAVDLLANRKVVVKVLKPVRQAKIEREIMVLHRMQGVPNVVQLLQVVKEKGSNTPCFVTEYIHNAPDTRSLMQTMSADDIRYYMYQLVKTLAETHRRGVIHRDIKPQNIIINPQDRQLRLIDWGLAEFYLPGKKYNVRVASRYFKGPELLTNDQLYDYSLDIWSLGAMFAGIIFRKEPFFKGNDNLDQLVKIVRVLGKHDLDIYLRTYNLHLDSYYDHVQIKYPRRPWARFITQDNQHLATEDALDLLDHMLRYDKAQRITAEQMLGHRYFSGVAE